MRTNNAFTSVFVSRCYALFGLMHNFERISIFCAFYTISSLRKPIFFARACGARDALVSALVGENRDDYMCVLKNGNVEYWSLEESPGRIQTQEAEKGKTEVAGPKDCSMCEAIRITRR